MAGHNLSAIGQRFIEFCVAQWWYSATLKIAICHLQINVSNILYTAKGMIVSSFNTESNLKRFIIYYYLGKHKQKLLANLNINNE